MSASRDEEEDNWQKLASLTVNEGTSALRNCFDSIHPPETLKHVVDEERNKFKNNKKRKRVVQYEDQEEKLYPSSGDAPDSKTFDITQLGHLLRHPICNLKKPKTGWKKMPADDDNSDEANIMRIIVFRNELFHPPSSKLSNDEFRYLLNRITRPLVALGIEKGNIDRRMTDPSDPDTERRIREEENKSRLQNREQRQEDQEPQWKGRTSMTFNETPHERSSGATDIDSNVFDRCQEKYEVVEETIESETVIEGQVSSSRQFGLEPSSRPSRSCGISDEPDCGLVGRSSVFNKVMKSLHGGKEDLIIVQGSTGMGKSYFACNVASRINEGHLFRTRAVYISLESQNSAHDVFRTMRNHACSNMRLPCQETAEVSLLNWSKLLRENVLLVLDGFDEIHEDDAERFLNLVSNMRALSQQNVTFLMTSRNPSLLRAFHVPQLRIKEFKLGPLSKVAAKKVLFSNIECGNVRQNLTRTDEIVELCGRVPGELRYAGSLLSTGNFHEAEVIEILKRRPKWRKPPKNCISFGTASRFGTNWSRKQGKLQYVAQRFFTTFTITNCVLRRLRL